MHAMALGDIDTAKELLQRNCDVNNIGHIMFNAHDDRLATYR